MSGYSHDPHDQSRDDAARAAAPPKRPPVAFKPGDRVRITSPSMKSNGAVCTLGSQWGHPGYWTMTDRVGVFHEHEFRLEPAPPAAADPQIDGALVLLALAIENGDPQSELQARIAHLRADYATERATLRAENEAKTAEIARLRNRQREWHRRVQKAEGFRDRHKRTMAYMWRRRIEAGWRLRAAESRATRAEAECERLTREALRVGALLVATRNSRHAYRAKWRSSEAALASAVEALEPFAEAAESLDETYRDNDHLWESPAAIGLNAGELSRASSTLAAIKGENGHGL